MKIDGGARLRGAVRICGSVDVALPLLAATVLAPGRSTLRNLPAVGDVVAMKAALQDVGVRVRGAALDTVLARFAPVSHQRVSDLRACVLLFGPLLARFGRAEIALPGAHALGHRPLDELLRGLAALGARVSQSHGQVLARASAMRGAEIALASESETTTCALLLAAVQARGRTSLLNATCGPRVEELARALNKMGARVSGAGTPSVRIEGVDALEPLDHELPGDHIEAATLAIAAALTRGDVRLQGCPLEALEPVFSKLRAAGADVTADHAGVRVRGPKALIATDVATRRHPGFPSDAQAQFLALMTRAQGQSMLTETVFETRFAHAAELCRMGADIVIEGRTAIARGPCKLEGTKVVATDPRASAGLVLAGLVAEGTTDVLCAETLDRKYERLDQKLRALGASVRRVRSRMP